MILTIDLEQYGPDIDICVFSTDVAIDSMTVQSQAKDQGGTLGPGQDVNLRRWVVRPYRTDGGTTPSPEWIYDSLYCARGQAENLIKLHKTQLASDRTSCRSAVANQVRLVLHTAAYWLMLTVRDAIPKACDLAKVEFATLRLRLIKIAAKPYPASPSSRK